MPEWLDVIVRSFLYLATLFIITKLVGKKQLSELSFFEYVSGITIGSIAGEAIMGLDGYMLHGVYAILIFGVLTYLVDVFSIKSKKFRDFVEGHATVFIKDGKILEKNLKKEKYTIDEVASLLRQKSVFNMADVEFAVLEPKGDISILLKKDKQPVTPKDLNMKITDEKEPHIIIMDGCILDETLAKTGKNRKWLDLELDKHNVSLENVFFAQVDSAGRLYLDVYDDQMNVGTQDQKAFLLAMMKKCKADLELFSHSTDSIRVKNMYERHAKKLESCISRVDRYIDHTLQ